MSVCVSVCPSPKKNFQKKIQKFFNREGFIEKISTGRGSLKNFQQGGVH
jgi:hypothetical protein